MLICIRFINICGFQSSLGVLEHIPLQIIEDYYSENKYFCLVINLNGKTFSLSELRMKLAIDFFCRFIRLKSFPLSLICWVFFKIINDAVCCQTFLYLVRCLYTLSSLVCIYRELYWFLMLKQPCIPHVHTVRTWYIIFLIYCQILFANNWEFLNLCSWWILLYSSLSVFSLGFDVE